ncbi:MAG: DUF1043 family protein [Rhodocyclaceae bacterium]|nr:DUF1043 family protein [Rhodocyclaceae bacterium]
MEQLAALPQFPWIIAVTLLAIVLAFLAGRASRSSSAGDPEKIYKLEEALAEARAEMAAYRTQVNEHFNRTASLFVAIAEPCKALFEHMAEGHNALNAKENGTPRLDFREDVLRRIGNSAPYEPEPTIPEPDISVSSSVSEAQALYGDAQSAEAQSGQSLHDAGEPSLTPERKMPFMRRREPGLNDNVA